MSSRRTVDALQLTPLPSEVSMLRGSGISAADAVYGGQPAVVEGE